MSERWPAQPGVDCGNCVNGAFCIDDAACDIFERKEKEMDPCKGCDQEKPICCSECDVALLPEASCGTSRTAESNPIEIPDCEKCKGLRQEIDFLRRKLAAAHRPDDKDGGGE